jgi:VanZ family protein
MHGFGKVVIDPVRTRAADTAARIDDAAAEDELRHSTWVVEQAASIYITLAVLFTIGFFYASLIPLIFAVPDFSTRFLGMFAPSPWNAAQVLDVGGNILAFIPIGFLWAAACHTASPLGRTKSRIVVVVTLGCLGLAIFAEALQFWIPLRDPSLRDVLALEIGAVLGSRLWRAAGPWTTRIVSSSIERLYQLGGQPLFRLRWPVLLAAVLSTCLVVNCFASPTQLFLLYRFRSTSLQDVASTLHSASVTEARDPLEVLTSSVLVALLIVGSCRLAQSTVRFAAKRPSPSR